MECGTAEADVADIGGTEQRVGACSWNLNSVNVSEITASTAGFDLRLSKGLSGTVFLYVQPVIIAAHSAMVSTFFVISFR